MDTKQQIQEDQYNFPYHHLVNFKKFDNHKVLYGGLNYYSYISKVLSYIYSEDFSSILDVGCGDGKLLYEVAKNFSNKRLVGIDYSERAILFSKAFNYDNDVESICGDVKDLKEVFDVVVTVETLEHIPDSNMKNILDSIYERTKKGGRVIVSVPCANVPVNSKHYRHYTLEMLKNDFSRFTLEKYSYPVSKNKYYQIMVKISGKFSNFGIIRNIFFRIAKSFFYEGTEKTGTHVVCVFRK